MAERFVVTGIGGLCALGVDASAIWEAMKAGTNGVAPLTTLPLDNLKTTHGGEIPVLPETGLAHKALVSMDRVAMLGVIAAGEALRQSGLDVTPSSSHRIGAVMGIGIFGTKAVDDGYRDVFLEGKSRTNVFAVPRIMPSSVAVQVGISYGLRGPVFGVTSACASSNHAFAAALDQLRAGRADAVIAGGAEAPLVFGNMKAWESLRILGKTDCRPFSAERDGLVLGEGAGAAVIETLSHAQARGATILAEIGGVGMTADANDIVAPSVDGPARAIAACLRESGLAPEDVDYINAHGTGTLVNDRVETAAIRQIFGSHADRVSVSSTKAMHAHCLGASGALEMIACVNALAEGVVPPTINYGTPDPECDLDVTPNVARARPLRAAISNAFAFGGANAVVSFKRW
jgi:nodulation protein E